MDIACATPADIFVGNAQSQFRMHAWISRGLCIRHQPRPAGVTRDAQCYTTLLAVLERLNELRKSEYGGAAGVLTLLPTIGALLGAPSNEIWRLMSIVPFGGALAMALSFGGAIMPVKVEDYEHVVNKRNIAIGSIISLRKGKQPGESTEGITQEKLRLLVERVRQRIDQRESARLSMRYLSLGLTGMVLLFIGCQAAMIIVEQGGVIAWWCVSRWWMHLWYFMVTLTAITENWVQLPFVETYKLYVSSLPYDVSTAGGESIKEYFKDGEAHDNVAVALRQLSTLRPASITVHGSKEYTRPRNSVMIMVSVVGDFRLGSFWRLLSKSTSIAVFVSGTALFASVTLLSLPMAVMVLTLNLGAGVFGRAIAGWMVGRVSETEPMIHVISNTRQEAYKAVTEILSLKSEDGNPFQIEVNGHIFINERRVARRSPLHVTILGVIAQPYDLRKADVSARNNSGLLSHTHSWSLAGTGDIHGSNNGGGGMGGGNHDARGGPDASTPFLGGETLAGSPQTMAMTPGMEKRTPMVVQSVSHDSASISSDSGGDGDIHHGSGSGQDASISPEPARPVLRKPVRIYTASTMDD